MTRNAPTAPPLILDSTLREGEQTPGVNFSVDDKLTIAHLLDAFGVDIIEAGHPAVSNEVRAGTRAVATAGLQAEVLAHARCLREDIDLAISTGADWVGLFFSVRDAALEQRFRKDISEAERIVADAVTYAVDHGLKVRYTPEDTVRSDFGNVVRVANAAIAAGAHRISIADTTGHMTPTTMHDFVTRLLTQIDTPVNVHCHDDLGLATANALAAWEAGATLVDTTVNGLGERCGITDLARFTTTIETRYGIEHWDLPLLPRLAQTVATASGIPIHSQAPVVGRHAFSHNAGLHVAAVLMDPTHYESIPAARVGRDRTLVLDRFAGLPTVDARLRRIGIEPGLGDSEAVLRAIKQSEAAGLDDRELLVYYAEATRTPLDGLYAQHAHRLDPDLAAPSIRNQSQLQALGIARTTPLRATTATPVVSRRINAAVLTEAAPAQPGAIAPTEVPLVPLRD